MLQEHISYVEYVLLHTATRHSYLVEGEDVISLDMFRIAINPIMQ